MLTVVSDYNTRNDDVVTHTKPAELVRISWGSVFAGAIVGLAILAALTLLGVSIGFGVIDPATDDNPLSGVGIGSAFWAVLIMIASFFIAGFVSARLFGQPETTTAMMHGVTVWSVVTVAIIWLAGTAVGGLIGGTVSTVSSGASAMGSAVNQVVSYAERQVSQISFDEALPDQLPPEVQERLEQRGLTVENFRSEFRQAISNSALGKENLDQLRENATETVREIAASPTEYKAIIADFTDNLMGSGDEAVISEEEREQVVNRLVQRTGITRAEAEGFLDTASDKMVEARENVAQAFETAQEKAVAATETAMNGVTKAAFWSFFGLVLALVAAAGGAAAGSPNHLPRARV